MSKNFLDEAIEKVKKELDLRDYQVRRTIGNVLKGRSLDDLEKQTLQSGWPRLFGKKGSKFEMPDKFYIYATLDPEFAGKRLTSRDRMKIARKITDATEDRIMDVLESAKKGHKLSDWEQKILDAGWVDMKDEFSESAPKTIDFSREEFEKIKERVNNPNVDIFSSGKGYRTRFAAIKDVLDVESPQIRAAILKILEEHRLDPKDKRILQVGWPEHFGMQFGSFQKPKRFFIIRDLSPKYQGKDIDDSDRQDIAMEITGADVAEVLVAVQKAAGGEKLSKKEKEIIEAGWPDEYDI